MGMSNDISLEIEYKANKKIARIMRYTTIFFIIIFVLNKLGIRRDATNEKEKEKKE